MLFARCISRLARRLYPDCIGGCYVEGELQETIQGKQLESIEVPSSNELDNVPSAEVKEAEIVLDFPEDIDAEHAEEYIKFCQSISKNSTIALIKTHIANNMQSFVEAFKQWERKNFPEDFQNDIVVNA